MELASPAGFGHGGASGCMLWIDPVHDVVVAFVSNRHARADPEGSLLRITPVVNATLAAVSAVGMASSPPFAAPPFSTL